MSTHIISLTVIEHMSIIEYEEVLLETEQKSINVTRYIWLRENSDEFLLKKCCATSACYTNS